MPRGPSLLRGDENQALMLKENGSDWLDFVDAGGRDVCSKMRSNCVGEVLTFSSSTHGQTFSEDARPWSSALHVKVSAFVCKQFEWTLSFFRRQLYFCCGFTYRRWVPEFFLFPFRRTATDARVLCPAPYVWLGSNVACLVCRRRRRKRFNRRPLNCSAKPKPTRGNTILTSSGKNLWTDRSSGNPNRKQTTNIPHPQLNAYVNHKSQVI